MFIVILALATFVEALNRGAKDGGEGKNPVLVESAWVQFRKALSGFAAAVVGRESFQGTAEKRLQVPVTVEVVGAWSIKDCWAKVRYRHVLDLARTRLGKEEARKEFEKRKLGSLYTAFLVKEGSSWKIDFLAGRD